MLGEANFLLGLQIPKTWKISHILFGPFSFLFLHFPFSALLKFYLEDGRENSRGGGTSEHPLYPPSFFAPMGPLIKLLTKQIV